MELVHWRRWRQTLSELWRLFTEVWRTMTSLYFLCYLNSVSRRKRWHSNLPSPLLLQVNKNSDKDPCSTTGKKSILVHIRGEGRRKRFLSQESWYFLEPLLERKNFGRLRIKNLKETAFMIWERKFYSVEEDCNANPFTAFYAGEEMWIFSFAFVSFHFHF